MKYVIAFDIIDDRVRYRAVKVLLEYSYRVQKSVFEGFFSKSEFKECKEKLAKIIDKEEDSVRYYPLCSACEKKVEIEGIGKIVEETQFIII